MFDTDRKVYICSIAKEERIQVKEKDVITVSNDVKNVPIVIDTHGSGQNKEGYGMSNIEVVMLVSFLTDNVAHKLECS